MKISEGNQPTLLIVHCALLIDFRALKTDERVKDKHINLVCIISLYNDNYSLDSFSSFIPIQFIERIPSLTLAQAQETAQAAFRNAMHSQIEWSEPRKLIFWSSPRSISIGQLNTLLHLHLRPIHLVVFKGPY